MSTMIRPELSKKNVHYISKHRYYELKHFVAQYYDWKRYLNLMAATYPHLYSAFLDDHSTEWRNPTAEEAEKRERYFKNVQMVKNCLLLAFEENTDFTCCVQWRPEHSHYLEAIIEGWSFPKLQARHPDISLSKEAYYKKYHRFFWMLDQARK